MRFDLLSLLIITIVGGGFIHAMIRMTITKMKGTEVDAVVSGIEETDTTDPDGIPSVIYSYVVRYRTQEGRQIQTTLANPRPGLTIGKWIRVKYLPGKDDCPVMV